MKDCAAIRRPSAKALRYDESIGLLPGVARTASGYRDFGGDDVGRAAFIRRTREAGLGLDRARHILAAFDTGQDACAHVGTALSRELSAVRRDVAARCEALKEADPAACDRRQVCSYL